MGFSVWGLGFSLQTSLSFTLRIRVFVGGGWTFGIRG